MPSTWREAAAPGPSRGSTFPVNQELGFANWRPSLCRAGDDIVAAPGDNSLCVWSVGTALARGFETAYNWREDDESDDDCLLESSFSSDSGADAPPPPPAASPSPEKRPKLDYGPDAVVAAGEASLLLGDVVALPGTTSVVCAPVDTSFLDKPERPDVAARRRHRSGRGHARARGPHRRAGAVDAVHPGPRLLVRPISGRGSCF